MKKIFFFLLLGMPVTLLAQSIERDVVASAGGVLTTTNIQISHTVGEAVVGTMSTSSTILTQGFQQPSGGSTDVSQVDAASVFKVYPNPASDVIKVKSSELIKRIDLISVSGQTVLSKQIASKRAVMDIQVIPSGLYFLKIDNQYVKIIVKQ